MAVPPSDPDGYRRQQRRRAVVGWGGALAVIALLGLGAALGGDQQRQRRAVSVPYGETMTAAEFDAIDEGEEEADVLERLGKTGRPEELTEDYVLVLFPPSSESVECSYWEFADEPQIFARLCFDRGNRALVQKLARDVHGGGTEGEGTITASRSPAGERA